MSGYRDVERERLQDWLASPERDEPDHDYDPNDASTDVEDDTDAPF